MGAAYLYQLINLCVTVLMVPLLLRYLDVNGFVVWSLFTTFGGILLQMEYAIQNVSVREIAKQYHGGRGTLFEGVIARARRAYRILSAGAVGPLLVMGFIYLEFVSTRSINGNWRLEWLLFVVAYAVNFYFGTNNSILLGTGRIGSYNNINSLSRTTNFITTYIFLKLGYSVIGICASFLISVILGCAGIASRAKRVVAEFDAFIGRADSEVREESNAPLGNIRLYTIYIFTTFIVYRGGLLVAAGVFPVDVVGGFGLSLQAYWLLSTLALVPTQVWLGRLVIALTAEDKEKTIRELAIAIWAVNGIFILGLLVLVFFGDALLVLIGSKVVFLDTNEMLVIGLAYWIELNILVLANFLVLKGRYDFVFVYVVCGFVGSAIGITITLVLELNVIPLVLVPLLLQLFIGLPNVFRITSESMCLSRMHVLRGIVVFGYKDNVKPV